MLLCADYGQCVVVNNYFLPSDLKAFESEFKLPAATISTVGKLQHSADTEATLDVQYITTTGQNMNTTWVYIDGNSPTNPFELWLDWAGATPNSDLPMVSHRAKKMMAARCLAHPAVGLGVYVS